VKTGAFRPLYPADALSESRQGWLRDTSALLTGTAVSGLLAYAYVVLGTRIYGAVEFAPISVLWTIWAMSAAVITFPVQHWVIRTIEADRTEGTVRTTLPLILASAVILSTVIGVVAWLARWTLFSDGGALYPLLAATIPLGSVLVGLSRGTLAARRRFTAAAVAFAGENLIRVVAAAIAVLSGLGSNAYAIALIFGFLVVAIWPSALRLTGEASGAANARTLSFLSGVAGGTLISQVVLTGGPVILASLGGAPASVTGLFSTLALFRAPYILATGLAARLTGWLTQVAAEGRQLTVRRLMWLTVAGVVGLTPLAAVFGAIVGPDLIGLVFGSDVSLPSDLVGVVAAGSTVALGGLFSTLLLIAVGRGGAVIFPWVGAFVVGFAWAILGPGQPLDRVTWAFLVAEVVAFALMHLIVSWAGGYARLEGSPSSFAEDESATT
jgi:O-antigen/teichoic acid export membrane protein